jgi:hypothetical protein
LEVGAFFKDVVSMKYVAQKVAIIKREIELGLDFGGDRCHPVRVFAKECDVQGEYFLGCFLMQGLIAYGRACGGKAVEQRSLLLFGRAFKKVALAARSPFLA